MACACGSLDVYDNMLGREGAKPLAEALQHLTQLVHLELGCNHITDEGAQRLAPVC